jgi:hypothetical protein
VCACVAAASELWFAALSVDLLEALRNPFRNFRATIRFYHVGINSLALLSAAVLVVMQGACCSEALLCLMTRGAARHAS